MKGWICLVPTPIGNLEDITLRALRVLRDCDLVLAEDTRMGRKLLGHYQIQKPLYAYHKDNEHKTTRRWIEEVKAGKNICLISDAGMPGISDPGYLMIRHCLDAGIEPQVLPGPSAFVPALVKSGIPCHNFIFLGFPPSKKGRKRFLETLKSISYPAVLYESTHRIQSLAKELNEFLEPTREVCFAKEISKMHERFFRGPVSGVSEQILSGDRRGEWVVIVNTAKNQNHEPD